MPTAKSLGIGRLLIAVYGVLAFAATGRAGYELAAKFDEAPLPYGLSLFSALVYILATIALAKSGPVWRKIAYISVTVELVGVLVVGLSSILWPAGFTYSGEQIRTVWSFFGIAYGFVPLVLPFLGLVWLKRRRA